MAKSKDKAPVSSKKEKGAFKKTKEKTSYQLEREQLKNASKKMRKRAAV